MQQVPNLKRAIVLIHKSSNEGHNEHKKAIVEIISCLSLLILSPSLVIKSDNAENENMYYLYGYLSLKFMLISRVRSHREKTSISCA